MRRESMACKHGRRVTCHQCWPPQTTATGRAISPGRVTRRSLTVKRASGVKPLPLHLQCHPKALTHTPLNPGCFTYTTYAGLAVELAKRIGYDGIMRGMGLKFDPHRFELLLKGGGTLGYTDDPVYAKAWQACADANGVVVDILEDFTCCG